MKIKAIALLMLLALAATLLTGCISQNGGQITAQTEYRSYADFEGKAIGVFTGSVYDPIVRHDVKATPVFYSDITVGAEDIRMGRADGFMTDLSAARIYTSLPENRDMEYVQVPPEIFSAAMGAISLDQNIIDRFNAFLAEITADGTLEDMQDRWLNNVPDLDSPMPEIPLTGENGTLRIATSAGSMPFAYIGAENEFKGYSMELVRRFAAHEGMGIEYYDMEFGGMIPFILSGRADLAIADISITEERKQSVLFTDPIYYDLGAIIMLKQGGAAEPLYTDFAGEKIGVMTGSIFDGVARDILGAEPLYYTDGSAGIEEVRNGRVYGYLFNATSIKYMLKELSNENLLYIEIPAERFSISMGAFAVNEELINRFNVFLAELRGDGTYDDMKQRWLDDSSDLNVPMPKITLTGENGTLKVSITAQTPPFTYTGEGNEYKGFCVEMAYRFAAFEGMALELVAMSPDGLLTEVKSGKSDICIDATIITEERKQGFVFADPYYEDNAAIVVLKPEQVAVSVGEEIKGGGFFEWLKTGIERNLLTENRWKMIVDGLGITMIIAFFAQLFGTALGAFFCYLLTRKNKVARWIGSFYCWLIHGLPIVVLLMVTYYIIFGSTNISSTVIAVAAFSLITGAGVANNLKGAIDTVDPVEIEAARSIGFSAMRAFGTVTLPQAVRRALPGYTNGFVELVKATAIVGYVAIQDMMRAADIIRSRTYDAYFPLLFVAIVYLIITTICVQGFKLAVKKVRG